MAEATLSDQEVMCTNFSFPSHGNKILQGLNKQRLDSSLCDVTITVQGQQYKAHKSVLAAYSPYFHGMFTVNWLSSEGDLVMELDGVTSQAFNSLLKLIYTSVLTVSPTIISEVVSAATYLDMPDVVAVCNQYMEKNVTGKIVRPEDHGTGPAGLEVGDSDDDDVGTETTIFANAEDDWTVNLQDISTAARSGEASIKHIGEETVIEQPKAAKKKRRWKDEHGSFTCETCGKLFTSRSSYKQHMYGHRSGKRHTCKFCSKRFTYASHLQNHMSVHSVDRPHKCPQCPSSFKRKDQLKFHQRIHSGFRPYQCKLCDKTFYHSGSFNEHMKVHTGTKAHQCRFCNKGFTSRNNMLRHQELHSSDGKYKISYKCKECKAKFPTRKMVSLHQKQEHGDKKCFVCGEMCKGGRDGLIEHTRFLHSGEKKRLGDENGASSSQQGVVYQCDMCETVFEMRADLVEHIKTHANDPILKCPYCQERHKGTYKLNVHMNMHAGQRMMVPKLDTSSGAIVIVMPGSQGQDSESLKSADNIEETTSDNPAAEKVVPQGGKVCLLGDVPESPGKEQVSKGAVLAADSSDQGQATPSKGKQSRPAKGTVAEKLGQLRSQDGENRKAGTGDGETPVGTGRRGRGRGRGRGRRSSRPSLSPGYRPILPSSLMNPPGSTPLRPRGPQQPIIILQSQTGVGHVQPVVLAVPPASPGVVMLPRGLTVPQQPGNVVISAKPGQ
ncbi:zinc finger and BTB domain-containing protein 17-like isoform X2 [Branchiostoma lanceolatum]|uniref:zinc finger and BTB domain-containing protein 17-like isoform X2 n=1 Tax=Branchiostoma lanceolatum TaxID=7740 RepID=UPI0034548996